MTWFATLPSFRAFYGLPASTFYLLLWLLPLAILSYAAEEFIFRGFFFMLLAKRGVIFAYSINAFLFALLHLGKPGIEVAFAFVSAIMLCWLTKETHSFLPAAFVHFTAAITLAILINATI
jgi:membrane protease YdiL (CAAX protease family)